MTDNPPKKQRRPPYLEIAAEMLEGAIPLVSAIVQMRNRPRTLDYMALSVASINAMLKGKRAYDQLARPTSRTFFAERDADGEFVWSECPEFLAPFIFSCVKDPEELIPSTGERSPSVFVGNVGPEVVSWESTPRMWPTRVSEPLEVPNIFVKSARKQHLYNELHRQLWLDAGSRHVEATEVLKFRSIEEDPGDVYITPDMEQLLERVQRFHRSGQPRSYLLEGPPGTGKTTAIRYVATRMGLRSVRIQASRLPERDAFAFTSRDRKVDPIDLLRVTRPEILILDDVDQAEDSTSFLEFISQCRDHCQIIMGSANNKHRLDGAALRAGRFDDHIEFHALPRQAVEKLLGPAHVHLADRFESWPIAYITDFMHKVRVLGEETALRETAEIHRRIEEIDASIEGNDTFPHGRRTRPRRR